MCHQTVGLIARQLEAAGIATVSLTSARDITASAHPPRAVFVDFPLGHTSGRVEQPELSRDIVLAALRALENDDPGHITDLSHVWADTDAWKDDVMRVRSTPTGEASANDDRRERHDSPQYQTLADAEAAASSHEGEQCLVCAGIDY